MIFEGIELVAKLPNDAIVFNDFPIKLLFIKELINKIIEYKSYSKQEEDGKEYKEVFLTFIKNYKTLLEYSKNNKLYVIFSKYTKSQEIQNFNLMIQSYDCEISITILFSAKLNSPIILEKYKQLRNLILHFSDKRCKKFKDITNCLFKLVGINFTALIKSVKTKITLLKRLMRCIFKYGCIF